MILNNYVPPTSEEDDVEQNAWMDFGEQREVFSFVQPGKDLAGRIRAQKGFENSLVDTLDPQPCSVNVHLRRFSDMNEKNLHFPFVIQPGGEVIGHSDLEAGYSPALLSFETRSRVARKGLACLGFYNKGINGNQAQRRAFGDWPTAPLDFVLHNYFPAPLLITEPFSPVQVSSTVADFPSSYHDNPYEKAPIAIIKEGREVTKENLVVLGEFIAYKTYILDDVFYFLKMDDPVDLLHADFNELARRGNIEEIKSIKPDFCLTSTDESVVTNGCPVYMFPFHFLDIIRSPSSYLDKAHFEKMSQRSFAQQESMPVTLNAGLINPGCSGRVVCENVTKGRDLERYFRKEEPFALVIPIPFVNEKLDNDSYQGATRNQTGICF